MKDDRLTVRFSVAAARRGGRREFDLVREAVEAQFAAEERRSPPTNTRGGPDWSGWRRGKSATSARNPSILTDSTALDGQSVIENGPIAAILLESDEHHKTCAERH